MSDVTLNGQPVMIAEIHVPRVGNWSADLHVDTDIAPKGLVSLVLFGDTWKGYVIRSGEYAGRFTVTMVGGKWGLGARVLKAKGYANGVQVRLPLSEMIADMGEQLAGTSTQAVLSLPLQHWIRFGDHSDRCLSQLLDVRAGWRVLPDGTIWVGTETWGPAPDIGEYVITAEKAADHEMEIAVESAKLLPGVLFEQKRVSTVIYHLTPSSWRARIHFEDPNTGATEDKVRQPLVSLIEDTMRHVDFHARYTGKVVQMRGSDKCDVIFDDQRFPQLTHVPIRFLPGCTVELAQNDRVLCGFENGAGDKPFIEPWGAGHVTTLKILASNIVIVGQEAGAEPAAKATTLANWLKTHTHKVTCAAPTVVVESTPPTVPPTDFAAGKAKVG